MPHVIKHDDVYVVLNGNQRLRALKELGYKEVPVTVYPEDTSPEVIKARIIKSNHGYGKDDMQMLGNEWSDEPLTDWGVDLPEDWLEQEGEIEEDEAPEVDESEPPVSKLGEVYQLGRHRVGCMDSTVKENVELLMNGDKADMVFTDPPFPNNSEIMHDMIKDIYKAFNNSRAFCDGLLIWFWDNLEFPPFDEMVTSKHIWHKTNGWQAGHFETMYCYHNDRTRHEQTVYSVNNVGGDNNRAEQGYHPTPKPVSLVVNILKENQPSSVLDLFLGSGSTLIACEQTDRTCYGMELDPRYIDVIIRRFVKFTNGEQKVIRLSDGKDVSQDYSVI